MVQYHENCRKSCKDRLDLIREHITPSDGSLLDIGCAEGYYTHGLRDLFGLAMGIDTSEERVIAARDVETEQESIFNQCNIKHIVGSYNTMLYMSVHHHLREQIGVVEANKCLRDLSARCGKMFFDMGQKNENGCTKYGWWNLLPETEDVKGWLAEYLDDNTDFGNIDCIGSSPVHGIDRWLWKLS